MQNDQVFLEMFDICLIIVLLMQSIKEDAPSHGDMIGLFGGCVGCVFILIAKSQQS